jgi:hypothetical protein
MPLRCVKVYRHQCRLDELANVRIGWLTTMTALKTIVGDDSSVDNLESAFKKYNEEQFTVVKLPGGSQEVWP